MASSIVDAYEPVNTLKPFGDEIWIVDGPIIGFDYLGFKIPLPTRMTVVRLGNGSLWIHSPTELTQPLKDEVDALGPIRNLIAPNKIHYWWIGQWKRAYPDATVHLAPGILKRAAGHEVPFDRALIESPDSSWNRQIDQILVHGSYMTEAVLFHRRSRTLILTDLIENLESDRIHSAFFRALNRFAGTIHPDGKAPIDLRITFIGRRRHIREAVRTMLSWAPERVILAHGRCYPENAIAELKRAFRWVGNLER